MKRFLLFVALAVSACTNPTDNELRGEPCTYDLDCGATLLCAEFVCEPACQLEGDCDPGYACEGSICVPTCESQDDCERGTCSPRDNAEEGRACHVGYLPSCARGCAEGEVCEFGQCAPRCLNDSQCAPGLRCVPSYADSGSVCLVREDTEEPREPAPPLPEPENCLAAEAPRLWCEPFDPFGVYCGFDGECYSQADTDILFVIQDKTPFEYCADSVNALEAPGADLRSIKLWSFYPDGEVVGRMEPKRFHPIPSVNDFEDPWAIAGQNAESFTCEEIDTDTFLSLTCGGSLVFAFKSFGERTIQPGYGFDIEIQEYNGTCGMSNLDRYAVGICENRNEVLNGDYEGHCVFVEPEEARLPMSFLLEPWLDR